MRKAVFQYGSAKYITVLLNLILTSILSRILTPGDYGIVSVIVVFTAFFSILATMGLGTGVVQNKNILEEEIEGIFTFSVWISILLWFSFIMLSYLVAWFYKDNIYIRVMQCLSFSVLFEALNVVPNALILKEERFRLVSMRMIVSATISGFVAVIIALKGGKYYALVIQNILSSGIQFFWNLWSIKLHYRLKPNLQGIRKIGNYSFFQFLYSILLSLSQNLDNLLVGKYIGNVDLAYYNKSYSVMRYPINYIPHAISPVLHPILSKYQEDVEYIYIQYLKIVKVMSGIGLFFSIIFVWEAEEIILILFGNQWRGAIDSFRIFGFSIWFQIINAMAGSIYQSVNATKNMFFSGVIHISFSMLAIVIGILSGNINVLALCLTISWVFKFIIESFFLVKRSLFKNIVDYWKNFLPEFFIFVICSFIFNLTFSKIGFSLLINFLIKTFSIVIAFLPLYIGFGQYKYLLCLRKGK